MWARRNHRAIVLNILVWKQSGYTASRPLGEAFRCQTGGNSAALRESMYREVCVADRSVQTGQLRDERLQGARRSRTLELWGIKRGASGLGPGDGLRGPGEA